jgi:membrane-bound serine protease (ClpP class)
VFEMTRWLWTLLAVLCGVASPVPAVEETAARDGRFVAQIALDGPIGPAAAEYFDEASARAAADGAAAIVLRLDTPGGLAESMRQIITTMLATKIPVIAYVAPDGARAASAGTYILYAAQIAAMAPATHLGAATPVALGGGTPMPMPLPGADRSPDTDKKPAGSEKPATVPTDAAGDAELQKTLNDAVAYIRSLAQLRGRDSEWAEQAVRGAATLTASEALQKHVIDLIAGDVDDLLAKADGREVKIGDRSVTLQLKGLPLRKYAPDARSRFLATITNPAIAYLLLLAGVFGLFLEATHPGALLPGIVGGICLLVGLYALQLLPVNYAGLALMALGIGLLVAEALNPGIGALGVGGLIAFVVGSVMLMKTDVPGYQMNLGVIAGVATSFAGLLALILWLVFRSRRARRVTGDDSMRDAVAELLEPVGADGRAWALVHGERWRVHSEAALPAGARARVVRREGLQLWIAPD